ncbi:hypothetical protein GSI_06359 [Ganoderma sinense ZZ0214-1]|uniref:Uncharacterized protein n=1 Tax=Ganoderma sinense ZZ0214-1 TaxID=1077348 RepID=A0A2G8SD47_9APHY|nr:hypothetical protein GSI_06359 [Ganoderma sinense ZZ0214-1]
MSSSSNSKKGKATNPQHEIESARERIRNMRHFEPEDNAEVEDHVEWVENMTLAMVRRGVASAGAPDGEVEAIADDVYLQHAAQLSHLFDNWPEWASPILTGAHERAQAAAAARRVADAEAERERKQAERNARLDAFLVKNKIPRLEGSPSGTADRPATPAIAQPPVAASSATGASSKSGAKRKRDPKSPATTGAKPKKPKEEKEKKDNGPKLATITDPKRMIGVAVCEPLVKGKRCDKCVSDKKGCVHGEEPFGEWYRSLEPVPGERGGLTPFASVGRLTDRLVATPGPIAGPSGTSGTPIAPRSSTARADPETPTPSRTRRALSVELGAPMLNFEPHFPTNPTPEPIASGSGGKTAEEDSGRTANDATGPAEVGSGDRLQAEATKLLASYVREGPANFGHAVHELGTDSLRQEGIRADGRRAIRAVRNEIAFAKARIAVFQGVVLGLEQYEADLVERLRREAREAAESAANADDTNEGAGDNENANDGTGEGMEASGSVGGNEPTNTSEPANATATGSPAGEEEGAGESARKRKGKEKEKEKRKRRRREE